MRGMDEPPAATSQARLLIVRYAPLMFLIAKAVFLAKFGLSFFGDGRPDWAAFGYALGLMIPVIASWLARDTVNALLAALAVQAAHTTAAAERASR